MLRSLAVARVQRGLGFRTGLESEIISAMQEAQRLLELGTSLPYFLLQEDQTLTISSGSSGVSLPTRFIRGKADERPRLVDASTQRKYFLEKLDNDVAVMRFDGVTPGKPRAYVQRVSTIDVYPARDTSYSAIWSYYAGAEVLTTDIENAWLANAPEVLIGSAGISIAKDLRNQSAEKIFTEMFAIAWRGVFAQGILREEEDLQQHVGGKL